MKAPPGVAGRCLVFTVSRGGSVCRGDLRDCGPGGGVIDEVLPGAGGGDQGGGADVVDGAGPAAGGLVDLGDRLVGEQFGGAPGLVQVMARLRVKCPVQDRSYGGKQAREGSYRAGCRRDGDHGPVIGHTA